MGFIDWHKNKKDHYEDVLDYAKARREEEQKLLRDKEIRKWVGELLGDPRYSGIKSADAMKLFIREYQALRKTYIESFLNRQGEIDLELLWNDFWVVSIEDILQRQDIGSQQKIEFLQAMQEKALRMNALLSAEQYWNEKLTNRRYKRYLQNCFEISADAPLHFFRYIYELAKPNKQKASDVIGRCGKCRLLLAYYLYLSSEPGAEWFVQMEQESELFSEIRSRIERGVYDKPELKKLRNPVLVMDRNFDKMSKSVKVLLFNFRRKEKTSKVGIKMIEELYMALEDGTLTFEKIESILPDNVREQINNNCIPAFPNPELQILRPDERLFYLDHAVLYQGKEHDDEVAFRAFKGTIYLTDCRMIFRCDSLIDIDYENIDRVVEYDLLPELLEVICGGKSNFFQLPDIETAYRVLKLIANRNRGEPVEESTMPFSYEELVEKADLGACIFAFEYVMSGDIPVALKELIDSMLPKLKCLQRTVAQYPEKKDSIYQFLHYYVPEAVKVVAEYQQYQFVGLQSAALRNVFQKVMEAVRALDIAVLQKIAALYEIATMDTIAQADALREILSQDGFVDPSYAIK